MTLLNDGLNHHVQEQAGAGPLVPVLDEPSWAAALARLEQQILHSYAHNSLLYAALERAADLETITHFMRWDGAQPPFADYLRQWLAKTPAIVRPELERHIAIEVDERHSELFRDMLAHLDSLVATPTTFERSRLDALNYTFSPACADSEDIGFFLGGFWATEIMSARRCLQIYRGLRRNQVADPPLRYFRIHFDCDQEHGNEVRDRLIRPLLHGDGDRALFVHSVRRGVHDRLNRSSDYLRWYEMTQLASGVAMSEEGGS